MAIPRLWQTVGLLAACVAVSSHVPTVAHYVDPRAKKQTPQAVAPAHHRGEPTLSGLLLPKADASMASTRIFVNGEFRYITSDGLPDAPYGEFPNPGNPSAISAQSYSFRVPINPEPLPQSVPEHPNLFGVGLDGVPFDPGTAEFWRNNPDSGWHGEAMTAPNRLGLDFNNAHVQPTGAYHYHGIPESLLKRLSGLNKPVLVGYAADGYPIYGPIGYASPAETKGSTRKLKSSYRLKSGQRPGGNYGPGGRFDGTFTEDFEYIANLGDLDECNGRTGPTAEYPKGTYYYVLTEEFPYVPRRWHGRPDPSFFKGPPGFGRGPGGRFGRPPGPHGPPPGGFRP